MAHVRSLFFEGPLAEVENKALKSAELGRPSDIIWNITNRCNLRCDHCYMAADGHIKPDQLSDEETIDLVRRMGEAGVPVVFLSGGEPMMRPNFWDILAEVNAQGVKPTISTNCTMIDEAAAARLKEYGVRWIATSMYGPAEFHDAMVGVPGTHARVVRAIKALRAEGIGVVLKTALSQDTWPYIFDIIAMAKELDCGLVYICDLITAGRSEGEDDSRVSVEQWRELADFIVRDMLDPDSTTEYDIGAIPSVIPYIAEQFIARGVDVTKGLERLKVMSACPVGKGHMNINSEGGIMPCQFAQDWVVGNIREMSFAEATKALYQIDLQESKGQCAPENCAYSRICRGCRAKAWQRTGDYMAEDVTCILHPERARTIPVTAKAGLSPSAPCAAPGGCG
ncbi:MAG: radical SAM protein [Coriobacteriales bacterium]|nr:radical SAM protein [Actinomycetes bacterium]